VRIPLRAVRLLLTAGVVIGCHILVLCVTPLLASTLRKPSTVQRSGPHITFVRLSPEHIVRKHLAPLRAGAPVAPRESPPKRKTRAEPLEMEVGELMPGALGDDLDAIACSSPSLEVGRPDEGVLDATHVE
jgi:hypothetical protein